MNSPNMNVCMLSYSIFDFDNRVMRYAETLVREGASVDVIALRCKGLSKSEIVRGIHVFRIQERSIAESERLTYAANMLLFFVRAILFIAKRQIARRYDLVHVHSVPDCLVFTAWLPKLMGARIILDIHDVLPEFYASKFRISHDTWMFKFLLWIERVSAAFADHVIIANDLWRERLISRSVSSQKCTAILNFPDRSIFHRSGRTRSDDRFVMIYPGTLNSHQGVDTAIRALAIIKNQAEHAEFHIYGRGRTQQELRELSSELGLGKRVFFHDPVPLREVAQIMENADLGIVPKRNDGFGNEAFSTKTLEFMAMGVPVIVADTTIDRHYFNDSVVSFFRSNDEKDLARRMLELINHPQRRMEMIAKAEEFVRSYDWETNSVIYLNLIDGPDQRSVTSKLRNQQDPR
jgi:glycosyltransferase involved in cell wall biosynthesis